jgi:hypothetical protein
MDCHSLYHWNFYSNWIHCFSICLSRTSSVRLIECSRNDFVRKIFRKQSPQQSTTRNNKITIIKLNNIGNM